MFAWCGQFKGLLFFCSVNISLFLQINELGHVTIPVMLMPDDFKSYIKIRIDNHLFNKSVSQ